jgi:hypothetical protein
MHVIQKINVNRNHHNKTLHLLVEIANNLLEGLVDIGASMSVMSIVVVRELGLMHMVTKS